MNLEALMLGRRKVHDSRELDARPPLYWRPYLAVADVESGQTKKKAVSRVAGCVIVRLARQRPPFGIVR